LEFHFIWKWYLWCLICRWRFINSYKLYVIFNDIHIFFFLKENPGQVHRGVANGWSKSQVLLLVLRLLIRKNLPTTRPIDVPNPKPTLEYCPTKNTVLWWSHHRGLALVQLETRTYVRVFGGQNSETVLLMKPITSMMREAK